MRERQITHAVRAALTTTLLISALLGAYLAYSGGCPATVPLVLAAVTGATFWLCKHMMRRGINPRWLLVPTAVIAVTIIPELGLRAIGYQYGACSEFGPLHSRMRSHFVPDADLFWKRPVTEPGVNSFGFCGSEIPDRKPSSVFRIVILGDSCAEQDYARLLEQCLNNHATDTVRFEVIPLAVAGYSSYQGRVLADKYAALLEPDLAVVCFGWNDHWLANGPDDEASGRDRSLQRRMLALHRSRLVQLCRQALAPLVAVSPTSQVRVSPHQYETNLLRIGDAFRRLGTAVLFMTAPSGYDRFGVPDYIVGERLALSKKDALRAHDEYNQIVRAVAPAANALLVDLALELDEPQRSDSIFTKDLIHFTEEGLRRVSDLLCEAIGDVGNPTKGPRP